MKLDHPINDPGDPALATLDARVCARIEAALKAGWTDISYVHETSRWIGRKPGPRRSFRFELPELEG